MTSISAVRSASESEVHKRLTAKISSFMVVGTIGFAIEAAVLTGLTHFGWTPWQARIPSFFIAVLVTWRMNRVRTFRNQGPKSVSAEAASYIAIQLLGAVINLAIFALVLVHVPKLELAPIIPLAMGAAAGFVCNFTVSNYVLYRRRRTQAP